MCSFDPYNNRDLTHELYRFMGTMSSFIDNITNILNVRIPNEHDSICEDIKEIKELLTKLQTSLDQYINNRKNDDIQVKTLVDSISKNVDNLKLFVDKVNIDMISLNSKNLAMLRDELCNENSKIKMDIHEITMFIHHIKKNINELDVLYKHGEEKITSKDLLEMVRFAKTGNKIITYISEKRKSILGLGLLIIGITTLYKSWNWILNVIEAIIKAS
jgi:archaellum component FlaC